MRAVVGRAELVLERLSPRYRKALEGEQARFETFCKGHHLRPDREAVTLYLTDLMRREKVPASRLRIRLGYLDAMSRAHGSHPFSADPRMQLFIRGLSARAPTGLQRHVPPLYAETVPALIDAIDLPSRTQLEDGALLAVAHHARLRAFELAALRWSDVRIRRSELTIRLPTRRRHRGRQVTVAATGQSTCPVAALKRLYYAGEEASGPVFYRHQSALCEVLDAIGYTAGWTHRPLLSEVAFGAAYERLVAPTPRQARDRSIVLLAAAAHLKTGEVVALRSGDVMPQAGALVLSIPGRRNLTMVRRQPQFTYCPVVAWERWCKVRAQASNESAEFAFVQVDGERKIRGDPMTVEVLNRMIHSAARVAGLDETWGFGSLRVGAIRTEARHGTPTHIIATKAGLASLKSVEFHQQREALLTNNVAARLGL